MPMAPEFPRFLFRVKDPEIEREAKRMVEHFGIDDIEIRRDDTIKDAWLEDYERRKTVYGLEEIEEYLQKLVSGELD
ncbi:MAG: hypothetical protein ACUVUT_07145 [Candidatus Bipolaricaulia bacterium]